MHEVLYNYGLRFSYDWAIPYWYLLTLLFWSIALIGVSAYYIDREKVDKAESLAIFGTLLIEYHGGFLDTIFFTIERLIRGTWGNAYNNWWWHPFSSIFGYWDLNLNVILNIICLIAIGITWYLVQRGE